MNPEKNAIELFEILRDIADNGSDAAKDAAMQACIIFVETQSFGFGNGFLVPPADLRSSAQITLPVEEGN